MPTYRVHFSADAQEPIPLDLATLPVVEAADPLTAVELLLKEGRVPQDRLVKWARVVVKTDLQGRPIQAVRVPITPERTIPIDWPDVP